MNEDLEIELIEPKNQLSLFGYDAYFESFTKQTYLDLYNFAWDLNLWFIDLLKLMEIVYLDLMEDQKLGMKNFNQEIINLSKYEANLILLAFLLQFIIFIIIQFFEISSVVIESSKKRKKK